MMYSKLKMTKQRRIILEELCKVKIHPSVDEIYNLVRKRLSHISLGTVYRNLEILSEAGIILKLAITGSQKRFDGNTNPHYHFRCIKCNEICDVDFTFNVSEIKEKINTIPNISGFNLEFYGFCENCLQDK